ncbi:phage major capsid protein [Anaerotruncus colihominis]|uniref:Phage major capsid protein n=1 Tax=Anaerotruncus colihominis TaxID=169435 RepID=A0A1Y4MXD5_9FIRM|nr:phage major capsid protein [Anaerotruncus colihominis]OUP69887.1 phage major capsid protein [Anaerotruncus colihominis]OUP73346.1 phage major capsid protein [Anaerotruncus colihominis]
MERAFQPEACDFSGWATRNDLKCSDGRVIRRDAFKHDDGIKVPLVWNHQHNDPRNVLGHAWLENRPEGVYTYGFFNDSESGEIGKILVKHGDICALSIYANQLQQRGCDVLHGEIREVSLVHAGANPGAFIDSMLKHGEDSDDEAIIYTGMPLYLSHSDANKQEDKEDDGEKKETPEKKSDSDEEKTVADVINSMTEEQKNVMYAMIGQAMDDQGESDPESEDNNDDDSKGGTNTMKHNVFDKDDRQKENVLIHSDGSEVSSEEISTIFGDIKRYGSLKDSVLAHGIDNVDYLFPDAQTLANTPEFIQRDTGWVKKVMSGVHHTPFSRIKSIFADITEDDARAKGYFKGKLKKEEVFGLLKRTTTPTTVYKKQKMDRDDVVDITDFDVVAWLKSEMRMMLDEELARAYLIGDGRLASSDDKINEQNIRPILKDEELYTIQAAVSVQSSATEDDKAREFIRTAIKARKNYKGSGQPTLYTTEDILTDCLLLTDTTGRDLYTDVAQLAKKLRVKEIVTVPVMEGVNGKNGGALMGIIVNLADYNVGADRGGAVNMFDDFDIDYNQQKYLIETRCSGALIKPYSAIALELSTAG